jgi:hypothetical protein
MMPKIQIIICCFFLVIINFRISNVFSAELLHEKSTKRYRIDPSGIACAHVVLVQQEPIADVAPLTPEQLKDPLKINFPVDTSVMIFDFLDPQSFLNTKPVSKLFNTITQDPKLLFPSDGVQAMALIRADPTKAFERLLRTNPNTRQNILDHLKQQTYLSINLQPSSWLDHLSILKLGAKLTYVSYEEQYTKKFNSLCYEIQCADSLILQTSQYKDPKILRKDSWEVLAHEDDLARAWLIKDYEEGKTIYKDNERLMFWKDFDPRSVVHLSVNQKDRVISKSRNYPFKKLSEWGSLYFPTY